MSALRPALLLTGAALFLAAGLACGGGSGGDAIPLVCDDNAMSLVGDPGTTYTVSCPAKCGYGTLYGTDVYTSDSAICKAGMHAGVIDSSGGTFTVTLVAGLDSYPGSDRNGISSADWDSAWANAFTVSD